MLCAYRALVLAQPMLSLTDLALGLVTLYLAWRLPRGGAVLRQWRAVFAWAAGTALAGALYHGVVVGIPTVNALSWAVLSIMVVVVVSYVLAASVVQVLGRSRAVVFWLLRSVGLVAYVVLAAAGHASITAIMWCESLTIASVLGLWIWAWCRHHPMGRPMLVAIGATIAAALLRLVPGAVALGGLDPDSGYHLGQIAGMVLLYHAVTSADGRSDATRLTPAAGPSSPSPAESGARNDLAEGDEGRGPRFGRWPQPRSARRRWLVSVLVSFMVVHQSPGDAVSWP